MSDVRLSMGDIFGPSNTFVGHGVNTAGVMGAGIAPQFARRFPGLLEAYREHIRIQRNLGRDLVGTSWSYPSGTRVAVNLFSQDAPGPHARIDWLESALRDAAWHLPSGTALHLPWIGAGIGGLTRFEVAQTLVRVSEDTSMPIVIHELEHERTTDSRVLQVLS